MHYLRIPTFVVIIGDLDRSGKIRRSIQAEKLAECKGVEREHSRTLAHVFADKSV
jgi:hypothetical protein